MSEIVIRDNRAVSRAASPFRRPDPRSLPPNDNPPVGSVGPNVPEGFGDTHAIYQAGTPVPMAWQGWPVSWGTQWDDWRSIFPRAFGKLSTVWSCVMANARPLSMLPPVLQRDSTPMPRADWRPWLRNPHPGYYASWLDFMVSAVVSLQVRGEAFVVGDDWYADGFARWFHVAHPDAIEPVDELDWLSGRAPLFRWRDSREPIPDVLHIRYASTAGHWRGQGPLEHSASSEFTAATLEKYAANLAGNGGVPWGLLTNPVDLGPGAATGAQQQWIEASRSRLGAPAVLTGGWDIKALTISPKDMALLELREFDEQRIAAAFGVPPVLVGLSQPGSMNYSSTQMLADWHWRSTLQWLATNVCQALSNWALPGDQTLVLDSRPYTQLDLEARSRAYATMNEHDVLSAEEWRALENLGPRGADGVPGTADDLAAATNQQPTI